MLAFASYKLPHFHLTSQLLACVDGLDEYQHKEHHSGPNKDILDKMGFSKKRHKQLREDFPLVHRNHLNIHIKNVETF